MLCKRAMPSRGSINASIKLKSAIPDHLQRTITLAKTTNKTRIAVQFKQKCHLIKKSSKMWGGYQI